ncbi:MAG TPA: glycosyltransferase [Chitinophagales bacterium]|nr:glycosyltransferase [Chitinophagales bacterium]HMY43003.1 glycosyltransferase [Chitinophagales bacterium]HMZ93753.1 glycosyltransferase [Chitinophagales bacterium]HNE86884.1 glycosyltransferase [Chitinophagales bacterium]HNG08859.1 glycosyltransferase [Chitinophagales bacterium]
MVNYNVQYFLEQCLNSIFRSSVSFNFEVYVVDNASLDGSVDMLKKQFPQVKLIENKENVGFAKANNQAIKLSQSEYVLLINPDTIIQEDTLEKCVAKMANDSKIGALGIKMYDGNGKYLPESKRGFPSPIAALSKMSGLSKIFPKSKLFGKYHLGYLDKNQNHEVDVLSGAFMLVRKSVFDTIGLLDESYFMYGEDIDLSYRIQQAGYKNYYFAESNIIHFKGESTKKGNLNYIKLFYGAMIIFASKQLNKTQASFLIPLLKIGIILRAILEIIEQFLSKILYPLIDLGLMLFNLLTLKYIFEQYIKSDEHLTYPSTFMYINIPIYMSLWLLSLWIIGAYTKNAKWKHIFIGLIIGFLSISIVYSFLPLSLRSSRSIIVLGFLLNTITLLIYKWIVAQVFQTNNNFFNTQEHYILVCEQEECIHLQKLVSKTQPNNHYVGYVTVQDIMKKDKNYLGKTIQIKDILEVYPIALIYFSTDSIAMQIIVETMQKTTNKSIHFKMIVKNKYIISSNNKNIQGEIVGFEIPRNQKISILQKIRNWLV